MCCLVYDIFKLKFAKDCYFIRKIYDEIHHEYMDVWSYSIKKLKSFGTRKMFEILRKWIVVRLHKYFVVGIKTLNQTFCLICTALGTPFGFYINT